MYSRMEKNHGQKVQRFSIRKYSFGAASVAVAAYMMFGGAATVQADAQVTPKTASDSQTVPDASNQADSTMPLASTELLHQQLSNHQHQRLQQRNNSTD